MTTPTYLTQSQPANAILRPWLWTIGGITQLEAVSGTTIALMRTMLGRVLDAVDADRHMGGTAHRSDPATVVDAPQLRLITGKWLCAYTTVSKIVYTLSSP